MLVAGAMFIALGVLLLAKPDLSPAPGVFFASIGLVLTVGGGRRLLARTPRFRASAIGVWFGGGSIIPWHDVKNVYEVALTTRRFGTRGAIAFDFHRRGVVFRAPVACWLASPFGVGDIDISSQGSSEPVAVLASKLEALRSQANATKRA